MTIASLITLLPLLVLMLTAVVTMLVIAIHRDHRLTLVLTEIGLAIAFLTLFISWGSNTPQVTSLLTMDHFALFYTGLAIVLSFAVALLTYDYLEHRDEEHEELYVLLVLATLGSAALTAASHFASFFLALEILSVSLYVLLAYARTEPVSLEAGVKYLILAATSAAFLLFGMALVYADTGTMEFARFATERLAAGPDVSALLVAGIGLMIVGIGYKLAVVPFHLWTPDVYQGSPAPVTAFIATVSKGSMFALLLRLFAMLQLEPASLIYLSLAIIAILSMIGGNVLGLLQSNVKRVLAYSSIAQLGYILVAFLAGGAVGRAAGTFYLVTYVVATLGAFAVVTVVSGAERDADQLDDYRGLFWRQPWLASVYTVCLLSLAGIPLTGGFIGKFYVVAAGVGSVLWVLVITLVMTSVLGLFYYLRLLLPLYARTTVEGEKPPMMFAVPEVAQPVLIVFTALVIWFGVYPAPLIQLIQSVVGGLA